MSLVPPTIEAYQVQRLPIVKAYADKIGAAGGRAGGAGRPPPPPACLPPGGALAAGRGGSRSLGRSGMPVCAAIGCVSVWRLVQRRRQTAAPPLPGCQATWGESGVGTPDTPAAERRAGGGVPQGGGDPARRPLGHHQAARHGVVVDLSDLRSHQLERGQADQADVLRGRWTCAR